MLGLFTPPFSLTEAWALPGGASLFSMQRASTAVRSRIFLYDRRMMAIGLLVFFVPFLISIFCQNLR